VLRWTFAAWLMAVTHGAGAEPKPRERAVVAAIDLGPTVPKYVTAKATAQIAEGLAAAGYDVVPPVALSDELASCRAGACIAKVGASLGVQAVVYADIAGQDDNTVITMRLFDASTAHQEAEVREVCELCGEAELTERLGVAASTLRARASEARARRIKLTVKEPPRDPRPPTGPPPEPVGHSLVPGITIGLAGFGAIAGGLYLVAIDGRGTCSPGDTPEYPDPGAVIRYPDPNNHDIYVCRDVYRTKALGIVGLGVGALGVAAGAILVVRARSSSGSVEVAPAQGGAIMKVSLPW
jgi:hypothetical protein